MPYPPNIGVVGQRYRVYRKDRANPQNYVLNGTYNGVGYSSGELYQKFKNITNSNGHSQSSATFEDYTPESPKFGNTYEIGPVPAGAGAGAGVGGRRRTRRQSRRRRSSRRSSRRNTRR